MTLSWINLSGQVTIGRLHGLIKPTVSQELLTVTATDYYTEPLGYEVPHEVLDLSFSAEAKVFRPQGRWLFKGESYDLFKASNLLYMIIFPVEEFYGSRFNGNDYWLWYKDFKTGNQQAIDKYKRFDTTFDLVPVHEIPEPDTTSLNNLYETEDYIQAENNNTQDGDLEFVPYLPYRKSHPAFFSDGVYYYHEENYFHA